MVLVARQIVLLSIACFMIALIRTFFSEQMYLFDLLRPLLFFVFGLSILGISARVRFKPRIVLLAKFVLFVALTQSVLVLFQFFSPNNLLVLWFTNFFASEYHIEVTMLTYGRPLGLMGGPSTSGLLCILSILSCLFLKQSRLISAVSCFLFYVIQLLTSLFMSAKATIAFTLIFLFGLSLRYFISLFRGASLFKSFIVTLVSLFIFTMVAYFVVNSVSIQAMRDHGGLASFLSTSLRTSSLYTRFSYLQGIIFLRGGPFEMLFGTGFVPSGNTVNRVFDSDLLYFSNIYGVFGLALYSYLLLVLAWICRKINIHSVTILLLILQSILNPFFTSTFLVLPILYFMSSFYRFVRCGG